MICTCGKEMRVMTISDRNTHLCDDCMTFDVEYIECKHEKFEVLNLEMSNGKSMLKKYCLICEHTFDNPLKQSDYNISKLRKSTNERYHQWRSNKTHSELNDFYEIIKNRLSLKSVIAKSDYKEYIESDWWKDLRKRILIRDKHTCQICKNRAEEVHHLTYAHKGSEYHFELVSLCSDCHLKHYHPEQIRK